MMSTTVRTSVGEIMRIGYDALRGLGYSFGRAGQLVSMLAWSEAVNGCALRFLRTQEARIQAGAAGRFTVRQQAFAGGNFMTLDAGGKSLLDSGPCAFDLADAEALSGQIGVVQVRHSFGSVLVGELLARSLSRGLSAMALVRPSWVGQTGAEFDNPTVWLAASHGGLFVSGTWGSATQERPDVDWLDFFVAPLVGDAATARIAQVLDSPAGGSDSSTVLVISVPALDLARREACLASFTRAVDLMGLERVDDVDSRWEKAIRCGLEVDRIDWDHLLALVARSRVPTSEHSRSHAG